MAKETWVVTCAYCPWNAAYSGETIARRALSSHQEYAHPRKESRTVDEPNQKLFILCGCQHVGAYHVGDGGCRYGQCPCLAVFQDVMEMGLKPEITVTR